MNLEQALALINQLKTENSELKKVNSEQNALIYVLNKKLNKLIKENQSLAEKKKIIAIKPFISKNENLVNIVNEVEDTLKEEKTTKRGIKQGSKKHANIDFESLVSETRYEEPDVKVCPTCGANLVLASSKTRFVIETVPASVKIVKVIKNNFKCPVCNKLDNKIYSYVSLLNNPFPGSILTPSFAAYILYHKYELGIPLNHLSRHISSVLKVDISKQSLADYVKNSAILLQPVYEQLKLDMLNSTSHVIHSDETTLVISKDIEKEENRKKSYVYVYASSFYDTKQINIYSFHETRSINKTAKWLKDFSGTVICDDFPGYDNLKKNNTNISLQKCMAHVRRKFSDILKSLPQKDRAKTHAFKILETFSKIFNLEDKYKKDELSTLEIVKKRIIDQTPIKSQLYDLIFNTSYDKNSTIYSAIKYTQSVWDNLWTYLDNGFVEPTNNVAERAVKPFVIQRKVFQTAGSYAGATYTTMVFSIIRTALINNIDVEPYLQFLLSNILSMNIQDLLPYSDNIKNLFSNK